MSKFVITTQHRVAIWRAWDKRCAYSGEPVAFDDLEIDHVIPEQMLDTPDKLKDLLTTLGLPDDFNLNSLANWIPSHHARNRRKSGRVFDENSIRFFLNLAAAKLKEAQRIFETFDRMQRVETVLVKLLHLIDEGATSVAGVTGYLHRNRSTSAAVSDLPVLVTVSCTPKVRTDSTYAATCDELEDGLVAAVGQIDHGLITRAEPSERNGESLSVRLAAWNTSVDVLLGAVPKFWTVTEFSPWYDVYDEPPDDLYARLIMDERKTLIEDTSGGSDNPFGLSRCPECGSRELEFSSATDPRRDDVYYAVKCATCGWGTWTQ